MQKLFPRNLTARADRVVAGNPVTTRLESGVANCFPGLEFDHRNLDRRFFPGLVFNFVFGNANSRFGAHLSAVDLTDPDLGGGKPQARALWKELSDAAAELQKGDWYIDAIEQAGRRIRMGPARNREDGSTVWRLVHGLEARPVTLTLERRRGTKKGGKVTLHGWRRRFVDSTTGVIADAYAPGELTQSLCSPWQHDFRDCGCNYWASNHPDIVLAEGPVGVGAALAGAPVNGSAAITPIVWLRSKAKSASTASPSPGVNRAAEIDHYEINSGWTNLAIVLQGREIGEFYVPPAAQAAQPFASPDDLGSALFDLAGLELVLALEYLYAMYSIKSENEVQGSKAIPTVADDVRFVRHELLNIAVSEMRHLRWANQLLWNLEHAGLLTKRLGPSLAPAAQVPSGSNTLRQRALRPLDATTLDSFIAVEQPSGTLEGKYAKVIATLRQSSYSGDLAEVAAHIIADGVEHYSRFSAINAVLKPYFATASTAYLRSVSVAAPSAATRALALYGEIIANLRRAYASGDMEKGDSIAAARTIMFQLNDVADKLAANGHGIPFF